MATLAGVKVGKFSCYLDGYRYRVCQDAEKLAEEVSQRNSLLESLQPGKPDSSDDERFRRRVEQWKELALGFLPEICVLRSAIDSVNRRYFDGQQAISAVFEGFDQLLSSLEKTIGINNEQLVGEIERLEGLLNETGEGQQECPLAIDLVDLAEKRKGRSTAQIAYLVDMAKADTLEMLGQSRQRFELVDRHV